MSKPNDIDADLVRKLAGLLDETRLTEIEYAWGEFRLRVTRQAAVQMQPAGIVMTAPGPGSADSSPAVEDLAQHPGAVRSPMVGTVYFSAQPDGPPFVRPGDTVGTGDVLVIIEAMKVMNQIRAPKSGKIARILVENGGPVEFGQIIMLID